MKLLGIKPFIHNTRMDVCVRCFQKRSVLSTFAVGSSNAHENKELALLLMSEETTRKKMGCCN